MQEDRFARLEEILRSLNSVVVAFSGGVDSALLLAVAHRVLGPERCLGVTAVSPSLAPEEYDDARAVAHQIGARWTTIETRELDDPEYRANDRDRCYYCKRDLFTRLTTLAEEQGFDAVVDGSNADDVGDWRPGHRAGRERNVVSPLRDADITKDDIRELSRRYELPTAEKPSFACLASRLPYGTAVTEERLGAVARAETALRHEGFRVFRVRYHGHAARLELGPTELERLADSALAEQIANALRATGFERIVVDLAGFRSGSQNEAPVGDSDLLQIDAERSALLSLGFSHARAAPDGQMVCISAPVEEMALLWDAGRRAELVAAFRALGYTYVAADLAPRRPAEKALP